MHAVRAAGLHERSAGRSLVGPRTRERLTVHWNRRRVTSVPIPDYQSIMLPILRLAADGKEHVFRQTVERLADEFGLTPEERRQPLPSKSQPVFDNRVGWARTSSGEGRRAGVATAGRVSDHRQRPRRVAEPPRRSPDVISSAFLPSSSNSGSFATRAAQMTRVPRHQRSAVCRRSPQRNPSRTGTNSCNKPLLQTCSRGSTAAVVGGDGGAVCAARRSISSRPGGQSRSSNPW